ncbi:MAG: ABC transporter permease [Candidatus Peregrinibacteria bacterium]
MRSLLTILGILIGVMAIMLVTVVGSGAENLILDQVKGFGAETIIIEPGREPKGPSDFLEVLSDSLKPKDVEALKKPANVPGLRDLSPLVAQILTVSHDSETKRSNLRGSSELVKDILQLKVKEGDFFTSEDIRLRSSVAVIGDDIQKELFGSQKTVGEKLKIKDKNFRIVGVLERKGQGIVPVDNMVFIPYTTAREYLLGMDHFNFIMARAQSEKIVGQVQRDIELTLREQHGITDPEKDDFHTSTQADAIKSVGAIAGALTILLSAIAAISLLVGGVGIMNIMLVSVTERTREIGIRKAVGATPRDILIQFLLEAFCLTVLGGFFGIVAGTLVSWGAIGGLHHFVSTGWTFTFPWKASFFGVLVCMVIGLIFGLHPARQAARKNPIESLRYE